MRRHRSLFLSTTLLTAALFTAPSALAEPAADTAPDRPVVDALQVEPNACFDAAALASHVETWLSRGRLDRRIRVDVRGRPDSEEGVELTVLRDGRTVGGRRFGRLDAPCPEVRAALGLAIALAVDATVLDALGVEIPRPPPPAPPLAPAPPPPAPRPDRFGASVDLVGLVGALPGPSAGVAPGLQWLASERIHLRLGALFTAPSTAAVERGTVDVSLWAGRLDVCAAFGVALARLRACGGIAAGQIQLAATGFPFSYSPEAPWVAPVVRLDLRLPLTSWLGVVVAIDGLVPLLRPRMDVVDSSGAIVASGQLAPAGMALGFGPEITFR